MDSRCQKPRDFVSISKNLNEGVRKQRLLQIQWLQKYEWLLDEHVKLKNEMEKLCEEKQTIIPTDTLVREEGKTCLPAPTTTNGEYGWLAAKAKFQLEKYGSYVPQYPDPLKEIVQLSKNIPMLAPGKGFIW